MAVKIVVFAHVPPPHHGQSAMVKLMLDGLESGEYGEFEIHHVDARLSQSFEDIGASGISKFCRAIKFAIAAIKCRVVSNVKTMYYIPAPPKLSAMVRDWIILGLCRPFFPRLICHWHAVGLGGWTRLQKESGTRLGRLSGFLNRVFLRRHAASFSLTQWGIQDSAAFSPKETFIVPNGISDPCPDFEEAVFENRTKRFEQLNEVNKELVYEVGYLGHCHGGKGLWDAMSAVVRANEILAESKGKVRLKLTVAGEFPGHEDKDRFEKLKSEIGEDYVDYLGFVGGKEKREFFLRADCLCFPTKYEAESFGLVAVEALAFGIPPVCSDWRMLPDLIGSIGLPVAETGNVQSLAEELIASIGRDRPENLRAAFYDNFSAHCHLQILADAIRKVGND